jgi:hypothetical protein
MCSERLFTTLDPSSKLNPTDSWVAKFSHFLQQNMKDERKGPPKGKQADKPKNKQKHAIQQICRRHRKRSKVKERQHDELINKIDRERERETKDK